MANPTIKSIRVSQRFTLGELWYLGDCGTPEAVRIHTKPYWNSHTRESILGAHWIKLVDEFGMIRTYSCGDLGINGFKYDNRPCKLARTYQECQANINAFDEWFFAQDDHCDYD